MKKLITILCICLCLCNVHVIQAVTEFSVVLNGDITCKAGNSILTGDDIVTLTLSEPGQYFFNTETVTSGLDVTEWFTNKPTGSNYTATVNTVSATEVEVVFSGSVSLDTPATDTPIPIEITIPNSEATSYIKQGVNDYIAPVSDVDNTNAHYIINDAYGIRYIQDYEVAGYVGEELITNIVGVEITDGDEFDLSIENANLLTINGLTPTVTEVDLDYSKYIIITYSGKPLAPSQELIHTTIPSEYLMVSDTDKDVPDRIDVKFNIVPKPTPQTPVVEYVIPHTGVN